MIKVLYPTGCYGTYFARCLYSYTNLRIGKYQTIDFDTNGSSHSHRDNTNAKAVMWWGHLYNGFSQSWHTYKPEPNEQLVVILAHPDHILDYVSAQLYKHHYGNINRYLENSFTYEVIRNKLSSWDYKYNSNEKIPNYILRDFVSYLIADLCAGKYYTYNYNQVPSKIQINAQDIVANFKETFYSVCQSLDLNINVDTEIITHTHTNFLNSQPYHNRQIICNEWVAGIFDEKYLAVPSWTIFDEAYIQCLIRARGYSCPDIDLFPTRTDEMKNLIQKTK